MKITTIALIVTLTLAAHGAPSPYAGEQTREIKALSADEISGYLSGHGMGLARPAELNGFPGPRHVLDSASDLNLTPAQVAALTEVFDAMKASAVPLGEKLVANETELDRLFTAKLATDATVLARTREIGLLQGELRAVHLSAHLATVRILTPEQVRAYNHVRGYDDPTARGHDHAGHNSDSP